MTAADLGPMPKVPDHVFGTCVLQLETLETDAAKAALLCGLVGYFLSGVPWQAERVWSEAITRLSLEAAAVARNGEGSG